MYIQIYEFEQYYIYIPYQIYAIVTLGDKSWLIYAIT